MSLDWKGFPKKNTLGYWAHSKVTEKMKGFEYGHWPIRVPRVDPCLIGLVLRYFFRQ